MGKILVSGLVNIETTLKVKGFPIEYSPVEFPFFGVKSTVSGVGVNVAKALTLLGEEVSFMTIVGNDYGGENTIEEFNKMGIKTDYIVKGLAETAQSVIPYDDTGKRGIFCDLKDLQETDYPIDLFEKAVEGCTFAALCNINFSRPFLKIAKERGIKIATDVHVLSNIYDPYNIDFMKNADILFLSNENVYGKEEEFVKQLFAEYQNEIIVMGLGKDGALIHVKKDKFMGRFAAVKSREIINTIGAGDSLFTCFLFYYEKTGDPYESLKKAIVYAGWKIGEKGASEGLLKYDEIEKLYKEVM